MIILKSPIKFLALSFGEQNWLGYCGDAVPNILSQLYPFRNAEFKDIGQGNFTHDAKLALNLWKNKDSKRSRYFNG